MKAFCWQTGKIEFGRSVPDGALEIANAPAKKIRKVICATARHAYDGKTLLVPGVPEAADEDIAIDALIAYCNWIKPHFAEAK